MFYLLKRKLMKVRQKYFRKTEPALEAVYQAIVSRDLARLGIVDDFYPVGSAANWGLLYLIIRIAIDFQPKSVLDVGAGQTSILWSRLQEKGLVGNVLTLEHNPQWAQLIAPKVKHEIIVSPLRQTLIDGITTDTYEWPEGRFDVILCDGPIGTRSHSRFGIVSMVDRLAEDFIIIMDDSERSAEIETVQVLRKKLPQHQAGYVKAFKRQTVLAAGRYSHAAYF